MVRRCLYLWSLRGLTNKAACQFEAINQTPPTTLLTMWPLNSNLTNNLRSIACAMVYGLDTTITHL